MATGSHGTKREPVILLPSLGEAAGGGGGGEGGVGNTEPPYTGQRPLITRAFAGFETTRKKKGPGGCPKGGAWEGRAHSLLCVSPSPSLPPPLPFEKPQD